MHLYIFNVIGYLYGTIIKSVKVLSNDFEYDTS